MSKTVKHNYPKSVCTPLPPSAYKSPQQLLFEQIYVAPALTPEPITPQKRVK